ncbi:MAG TPA: FecR domain-containing protein [Opitutaceae bacterium]
MNLPPEADFDDDAIEELAASWLVQRSEGLSLQQEREFNAWLRADPRHGAAITRLQQACALLEKLPQVEPALRAAAKVRRREAPRCARNPPPVRIPFERPALQRVALAAAAALVLGFAAWWQWQPRTPGPAPAALYATAHGSFERIDLADGSVLKLNSDSAVEVRFSERERRILLASGEAYFTVAHDAGRPFIVEAGGVAIRAVGTAFNVRIAEAAVELLVTDGKVRLDDARPGVRPEQPHPMTAMTDADYFTLVRANQRALIATIHTAVATPPRIEEVDPAGIREALAWQERLLVFNDTPLREVAAQFNQHNRIQLHITDEVLAARRMGGTFAGDNVESFVRLLASDGAIVVERPSEHEIVLRKAP